MPAKDGRLVAQENEVKVLRALHRFGWLRTRDLAALVWRPWQTAPTNAPDLTPLMPSASHWRMAQRTLRRLVGDRLVLKASGPDGSVIYTLAEAGAARLRYIGIPASSGKDLVRRSSANQFRHRCIANEVAIAGIAAGFRVSTEREVAQGRWPGGDAGIAGKKPDVLLQGNGQVWWTEVERSRKNQKDYANLLQWLTKIGRGTIHATEAVAPGKGLSWGGIVFICTPAFRAKLMRDLAAAGWSGSTLKRLVSFETELYKFENMLFA